MNDSLTHEGPFRPMKADATRSTEATPTARPFDDLFLEHWSRVYEALVRLVGDPAEAEDLALETFMQLYQRPPAPAPGLNLAGWLHRVATNLGLRSIRSYQRRERYELTAGKHALESAPQHHPAEILAEEEQRRATRAVLGGMPERQATLLVLRYSGLSYKEIAQVLDLSPTSIGPLLLRAEREFEKRYRDLYREEP